MDVRCAVRVLSVGLALAAGAALLGCIHTVPVAHAATPTPVAVGFAFDHEYDREEAPPPEALTREVAAQLAERNLPPQILPFERTATVFSTVRDTSHRAQQVWALDAQAPLFVLVETTARFLTSSVGFYSWRVYVTVTTGRRGQREGLLIKKFELPATLQYDHEKEPEAVAAVAGTVAERVGALVDQLLQLPPPAPGPVSGAGQGPAVRLGSRGQTRSRLPSLSMGGAESIYFVLVDRFANGDRSNDGEVDRSDPVAFHGGDLAGVRAHLDDFQRLGIRTVWLSPVFKTRSAKFFGYGAFHGYWVEDLRELDARFGTTEELRGLAEDLHRRGMKLYLDLVLNHVGFDAPLTRQHPDWFHREGDIKDWSDLRQVQNGKVMGLPDLAQENPEVYAYLLASSLKWVDAAHVDGFRLDAVRHVPLSFWAHYNDAVHAHAGPSFQLLGEMLDGSPAVLSQAQKEGHFDGLFDFPLHYAMMDVFCEGKSPARLAATLSQDREYADPNALVTLVDNHDLPRVMTRCHGRADAVERALTFQLTARGVPSLTYGTELLMPGEHEPETRADMRFVHGAAAPMAETIKSLLALRKEHVSLQSGAPAVLDVQDGLFAYARVTADEVAVILTNTRDTPAQVVTPAALQTASFVDGLSAQRVMGNGLVAPAHSVRVLFAQASRPAGFAAWARTCESQARKGARRREVEVVAQGVPEVVARGVPLSPDGVYLVGSGPELGNWNPAHGLGPLREKGIAQTLPVDGVYEYKLVARHRGRAPEWLWEPGDNHVLWVKDGSGPLRTQLTWNQ